MNMRFLCVGLLVCVSSGCASLVPASQRDGDPSVTASTKHGAVVGAGIGCATGLVSGFFTHSGIDVKRCVVGAAAGAVVGGVVGYREGLKHAHELKDQAERDGLKVDLSTKHVTVEDGKGPPQQADALDRLTIQLRADDIARHGDATANILRKAAGLADRGADPVTITVIGTAVQRAWVVGTVRSALTSKTTSTLVERDGRIPSIELSPVPAPATTPAGGL